MAATIIGPAQGASPGLPGGGSAAYNLTAAQAVKQQPGVVFQISCLTGGSLIVNDASGLVTAQTITAITKATAAVVTISTGGATNPFAVGNTVAFASVGGMTQIIPIVGTVTAIGGVTTAWTITTNINSSAFTAWSSGGTIASFAITNEIWAGTMTAGQVVTLAWPCTYGITVSSVTTAVVSISFS